MKTGVYVSFYIQKENSRSNKIDGILMNHIELYSK